MRHIQKGKNNENIAARFLQEKGYRIIKRNWRYGKKEIDIISEKDNLLIIIEVKSRLTKSVMRPEEIVSMKKQLLIIEAAEAFIVQNGLDHEVRFDIIFVDNNQPDVRIEHIQDAFYPV